MTSVEKFEPRYPLECVEVVDALMGRGKTHAAVRYVVDRAENHGERWIFCSELREVVIARTQEEGCANELWRYPEDEEGTKTESLKELLRNPDVRLIGVTHELLRRACGDWQVQRLLMAGGFRLLLDETIEGLVDPYQKITRAEFLWHVKEGRVAIDPDDFGRVHWVDRTIEPHEGKFPANQLRFDVDTLHAAVNGKQVYLVEVRDATIFRVFQRVIVTTYQFEGTVMAAYLHMKGVPWEPCTAFQCGRPMTMAQVRRLVSLVDKYDKAFAGKSLSSTWYDKASFKDLELITRTIQNFGNITKCLGNPKALGFTVPAASLGTIRKKVQPKGFSHTRDKAGRVMAAAHRTRRRNDIDRGASCYIPCNARASNDYACKTAMVHAFNRFALPEVKGIFQAYGVPFSEDRFALNELVQWVWRSAVRNGHPVKVAILSVRMRKLFLDWLNEVEGEAVAASHSKAKVPTVAPVDPGPDFAWTMDDDDVDALWEADQLWRQAPTSVVAQAFQ